jgi:hypothetical protein
VDLDLRILKGLAAQILDLRILKDLADFGCYSQQIVCQTVIFVNG